MTLVTVTHRGTRESIKKKEENMLLPANYPDPDTDFQRIKEDNRKVVWVKKGRPKFYDFMFTGIYGSKAKAWVEFEIDETRLERPNGIGKIFFGHFQKVIVGDVKLTSNARFVYNK